MTKRNRKSQIATENIGKDEMNLLEFCIFSATKRVDRETKSLLFEDQTYCNIEKRKVNRKLTVAFSSQFGRPTVYDDMLLVALMKKTRDAGFESQRVYFTRYEIIKLLGWPDNGQSYERIDEAFNRLVGTHLVWDNAFWDNDSKSWVDRKFSIIDDAHLYDREKYLRSKATSGEANPKSWFKWSDVMFESFQAGYIKTIDLQKLNSLNENVGKRLYRWLDKHFKNPNRRMPIEISLNSLASRKLGFKPASASHLKRMIQPAIVELEERQILAIDKKRFHGKGKACIVRFRPFEALKGKPPKASIDGGSLSLEEQLIEIGVSRKKAVSLATTNRATALKQLEHLRYLKATGRAIKSDAAWLTQAIKYDYDLPRGFKSEHQRKRQWQQNTAMANRNRDRLRNQSKAADVHNRDSANRVANYLQSLSGEERSKLEDRAIEAGSVFLADRYRAAQLNGDEQFEQIYREQMICELIDKILDTSKL